APAARAAVAPDLAELLVLSGQWDAGAALIREALAELADRGGQPGEPSPAVVARLQAWWAGLSAYDPRLVGEFDRRLEEMRATAGGPDVPSPILAGLLAVILAWRGARGTGARALLGH